MKIRIIFIGSYPPPYHGSSIYLKNLTELLKRDGEFEVISINCSDKENELSNMGNWSFGNVFNAVKALLKLIFYLFFYKIVIVYITLVKINYHFLDTDKLC